VRQFLQFVGKGYDLPPAEIRERSDFWLEKVWLTDKADQRIKGLSRGMRQRLGLARTLLPNPALILLDEPAAGLDPAGRVQFRQLLADLRDQGKTIIVSSHILADMDEYCTHIAIMTAGAIVTLAASLPLIVLGICLITVGFFVAHSVASAWVGRLARADKGHASSLYLLFYYFGSSVTGMIGGWAWQHGGWSGEVALTASLALAGIVLAIRIEDPRQPDRSDA